MKALDYFLDFSFKVSISIVTIYTFAICLSILIKSFKMGI